MIKNLFHKLVKAFDAVETVFVVGFTLIIGLITMYTIVVRAIGVQSPRWVDEMGRIMLITTTLVGSSMAVKTDSHMQVDTLVNLLNKRTVLLLKSFTSLLCGVFYIYLTKYSLDFTMLQHRLNRTMESISVPIYYVWIIVTIAVFTMGVRYLIQFGLNFKKFIKNEVTTGEELAEEGEAKE